MSGRATYPYASNQRLMGVEARPQRRDRLQHRLHLLGQRLRIGDFDRGSEAATRATVSRWALSGKSAPPQCRAPPGANSAASGGRDGELWRSRDGALTMRLHLPRYQERLQL